MWEIVSKIYVGPLFDATPIVEGVISMQEVGANNFPHRSHFVLISFAFRSRSAPVAIVWTLVVDGQTLHGVSCRIGVIVEC